MGIGYPTHRVQNEPETLSVNLPNGFPARLCSVFSDLEDPGLI